MNGELQEQIDALRSELNVLKAKEQIRDVLARYCRGVDRLDRELLRSCYHSDSYDDHTPFVAGDADEFVEFAVGNAEKSFFATFYAVMHALIDVDGDRASVESYYLSAKTFRQATSDGTNVLRLSGMRFLDRFEKRDGEWKISYRKIIPEWGVFNPLPTESIGRFKAKAPGDDQMSKRDRTDLSYDIEALSPPA